MPASPVRTPLAFATAGLALALILSAAPLSFDAGGFGLGAPRALAKDGDKGDRGGGDKGDRGDRGGDKGADKGDRGDRGDKSADKGGGDKGGDKGADKGGGRGGAERGGVADAGGAAERGLSDLGDRAAGLGDRDRATERGSSSAGTGGSGSASARSSDPSSSSTSSGRGAERSASAAGSAGLGDPAGAGAAAAGQPADRGGGSDESERHGAIAATLARLNEAVAAAPPSVPREPARPSPSARDIALYESAVQEALAISDPRQRAAAIAEARAELEIGSTKVETNQVVDRVGSLLGVKGTERRAGIAR